MIADSQLQSEFSYGNFSSIYSSEAISTQSRHDKFFGGEREFDKLIQDNLQENCRYRFPCFGKFQESLKDYCMDSHENELFEEYQRSTLNKDVELYIVINTSRDLNKFRYIGHYCWMSVEELIDHINAVKSLFENFEFSVMKDDDRDFMKVKFLFKKDEITLFKIRFLLTWMRYSYEWAISMATLDAYRLLRHPEYIPELKNENIFNLVEITNKLVYGHILQDQVICSSGCPLEFEQFKARVNKATNSSLNEDIYKKCGCVNNFGYYSVDAYFAQRNGLKHIERKKLFSLNWWLDEESFVEERLPKYINILNILKNVYKYEPAK